jgi:hypothetical protein
MNASQTTAAVFRFKTLPSKLTAKSHWSERGFNFYFSGKIGFMAFYDNWYYPVSFLGLGKRGGATHLPDVIKILIPKNYYDDGKLKKAA